MTRPLAVIRGRQREIAVRERCGLSDRTGWDEAGDEEELAAAGAGGSHLNSMHTAALRASEYATRKTPSERVRTARPPAR